ncbi:MAG: hypothetical protein ABH813_00015 [Patescibacteria group bacterium]
MVEEKAQYISLQEATEYCDYSQEYLSLRIRQGKLRGKKFARNWVTKKEWLEEYLKEVRERNCNSVKNNFKYRRRENFIGLPKKDFPVPEGFFITQELVAEAVALRPEFSIKKFSAFAFAAVFIFIFCASAFSPSLFQKKEIGQELSAMSAQSILQSSSEIFLEYGQWLGESIGHQFTKIKIYIAYIGSLGKKPLAETGGSGTVVVPSTENDQVLKEKIKTSFSDEVKVELKDESSGIITPIFRGKEGEKYLYIMVPFHPVR